MKFEHPLLRLLIVGALAFVHFHRLAEVPGLHYDEAWALNYAWRIAHESGFWPLSAMSPYTAPWAHYWAALSFRLFGDSLLTFRASQVALSLSGLYLLGFALPRPQRLALLAAAVCFPALALNHRFAIELNGLHAFAFGLFAFALTRHWWKIALAAALLGTTAHALFYAVPLATVAMVFLSGFRLTAPARRAAVAYFALTALFFAKVLLEIPEKGKAGALVASALALAGLLLARAEEWRIWKSPWWERLLLLGAIVFLGNTVFFATGLWSASISTGRTDWWSLIPHTLLIAALTAFALYRSAAWARQWFLALLLCAGAMMLKPAPRYFELPLLALAAVCSAVLVREWGRSRKLTGGALVLFGFFAFTAYGAYFRAAPIEHSFRYLFFKDSSRDFLDKQSLVRFLGGSGCALSDIHTSDPRLKEALLALSRGSWPVTPGACPFDFVSRRADAVGPGEAYGDFLLRRKR